MSNDAYGAITTIVFPSVQFSSVRLLGLGMAVENITPSAPMTRTPACTPPAATEVFWSMMGRADAVFRNAAPSRSGPQSPPEESSTRSEAARRGGVDIVTCAHSGEDRRFIIV